MSFKFIRQIYIVLVVVIFLPVANATPWTLQKSIAEAMSISPELKQSVAEIGAKNAELELSGLWPDPSIEFKVDNQIGQDDGSGDYGLSEITISQDIPLSRIKYQKLVAEAQLSAAKHLQNNSALLLQNRVAKVFYKLQFAFSKYELAEKRVKLADKLNASAVKNNDTAVVRYLTPLEKMRLSIIREKAHQAESAAEGNLQETLTEFYKLLGLDASDEIVVPELVPVTRIPELSRLTGMQENHPIFSGQQESVQAAMNEVDLARSSSMRDPSISVNRLRENFSTGTENVYGIMLNFEIPIHDRKSSAVSKANYNVSQQRIELARLKRGLQINLKRSYTHLNHVIEQATEFKKKVLKPASKMLQLSERGFISGELNILSLVDANSTYFEARKEYLDLIYQTWVELADINLYAGNSIIENSNQVSINLTGIQ